MVYLVYLVHWLLHFRKLKPDIVHASLTLSPLDFLLPEICEELNIPLVATFHAQFDSKPRNIKSGTQFLAYQLYAPFLANYERVIIFSEIQKDLLMKYDPFSYSINSCSFY